MASTRAPSESAADSAGRTIRASACARLESAPLSVEGKGQSALPFQRARTKSVRGPTAGIGAVHSAAIRCGKILRAPERCLTSGIRNKVAVTKALTGLPVTTVDEAIAAARALRTMGAGAAIITLGDKGALYHDAAQTVHVPAISAGPVVETTGAGDAFNGGFAAALANGADPVPAVRFGCATAGISVTRAGTAPSMPARAEIEALLARA